MSEPPVSDDVEIPRPRTNLGLGPAKNEALRMPPPEEPIEPVPADFAQRLGMPDNDAPLPRDTAVMNLDVVWRSTEDSDPPKPMRPDEDEDDDIDDALLGDGPLPQDDLPAESEKPPAPPAPAPESHARLAQRAVPQELPEEPEEPVSLRKAAAVSTVLPLVIVIVGLIAGYLIASLLLDACS